MHYRNLTERLPWRIRLAMMTGLATVVLYAGTPAFGRQASLPHRVAAPGKVDGIVADDLVCGPRCVQYLLQYYGQEADLIELVREIQWPQIEYGADLDAIDKSLTNRGIHTFGMQVAPNSRLTWPYPVLVHLNVEGAKIGHYAVCLPSTSGKVKLWCGLAGTRWMSESEWAKQCSGAILLTAPEAISDPNVAIQKAGLPASIATLLLGSLGCLVSAVVLSRRAVRSYVRRFFTLSVGEKS